MPSNHPTFDLLCVLSQDNVEEADDAYEAYDDDNQEYAEEEEAYGEEEEEEAYGEEEEEAYGETDFVEDEATASMVEEEPVVVEPAAPSKSPPRPPGVVGVRRMAGIQVQDEPQPAAQEEQEEEDDDDEISGLLREVGLDDRSKKPVEVEVEEEKDYEKQLEEAETPRLPFTRQQQKVTHIDPSTRG